jgi:hypothetical protein
MLLAFAAGTVASAMEPGMATGLRLAFTGFDAMEPGMATGLGLAFTGLDAMVLLPPLGRLVSVGFNRADITCIRPAEILCLALSTCSHSFKSKVSTSANCFSFNSNLFSYKFSKIVSK